MIILMYYFQLHFLLSLVLFLSGFVFFSPEVSMALGLCAATLQWSSANLFDISHQMILTLPVCSLVIASFFWIGFKFFGLVLDDLAVPDRQIYLSFTSL